MPQLKCAVFSNSEEPVLRFDIDFSYEFTGALLKERIGDILLKHDIHDHYVIVHAEEEIKDTDSMSLFAAEDALSIMLTPPIPARTVSAAHVDVAEDVHQPRLDPSAVHRPNDVQNSCSHLYSMHREL